MATLDRAMASMVFKEYDSVEAPHKTTNDSPVQGRTQGVFSKMKNNMGTYYEYFFGGVSTENKSQTSLLEGRVDAPLNIDQDMQDHFSTKIVQLIEGREKITEGALSTLSYQEGKLKDRPIFLREFFDANDKGLNGLANDLEILRQALAQDKTNKSKLVEQKAIVDGINRDIRALQGEMIKEKLDPQTKILEQYIVLVEDNLKLIDSKMDLIELPGVITQEKAQKLYVLHQT